jgi:hypothetical protein
MDWEEHAARGEARYLDGESRLPDEPDARQRQLVRMAMAAGAAGLARLMQGRADDARAWLVRAAERYRESWDAAPPGSWGRPIGALKARVLAEDAAGAGYDATWTLAAVPEDEPSPIGEYAAVLALLVLGRDAQASERAEPLRSAEGFPSDVGDALAALARGDGPAYADAAASVLRSFEERDAYLEDIPVADTVLVLEHLAAARGLAAGFRSPLLPPAPSG